MIHHTTEGARQAAIPVSQIRNVIVAAPHKEQAVKTIASDLAEPVFDPRTLIPSLWLIGVVLILGVAYLRLIRLRRKLSEATICGKDIYRTDVDSTPFIYGLVRPKIYIPYAVSYVYI